MNARRPGLFFFAFALGALLALRVSAETPALDPRIEAAVALYRQDGAEKALPVFERLSATLGKTASPHDQAAVLHYIGECHWRLGEFERGPQLPRPCARARASVR